MFCGRNRYKVKLRGRSGVVYEEGGKTVQIEAEMLAEEIDLVIYFESIRHWESLEERKRIKANVTAALKEKGLAIEWE